MPPGIAPGSALQSVFKGDSRGRIVRRDSRLEASRRRSGPHRVGRPASSLVTLRRFEKQAYGNYAVSRVVGIPFVPHPPIALQSLRTTRSRTSTGGDEELRGSLRRLADTALRRASASKPQAKPARCKRGDRHPRQDSRRPHIPKPPAVVLRITGPRRSAMTHRKMSDIGPTNIRAAPEAARSALMLRRSFNVRLCIVSALLSATPFSSD